MASVHSKLTIPDHRYRFTGTGTGTYDEAHGTKRMYARLQLTAFKSPVKLLQLGILVESLRDDCVDPCVHECTQLNHAQ